jgi:branched-chain amino acid transport system permease protein
MAVIGGIESLPGAVIGAVVVYLLSETLRSYGEWRFVLMGLALILVQRFAQNGLFPIIEQWGRRRLTAKGTTAPATASEKSNAG